MPREKTADQLANVKKSASGHKLKSALLFLSVFTFVAAFFFLTSSRMVGIYDEGFVLTAAMRTLAGQLPHRDFYYCYGPAQYWILALCFKICGSTLLTARLLDVCYKSGIVLAVYFIVSRYCDRWLALTCSTLVFLWTVIIGMNGGVLTPVVLLNLLSLGVLPVSNTKPHRNQVFIMGLLAGISVLFRYDTGPVLIGLQLLYLLACIYASRKSPSGTSWSFAPLWLYCLGCMVCVFPLVILFISHNLVKGFVFDLYTFMAHYYKAGRGLPFPPLPFREPAVYFVYLPVFVILLGIAFLTQRHDQSDAELCPSTHLHKPVTVGFLVFLTTLTAAMYAKGTIE